MNLDFKFKKINIDGRELLAIEPSDNMSDAEYDEVKPLIESMSGHWRQRVKAFVFRLCDLDRGSELKWQEEMQFFPTPVSVAKSVVDKAGLRECSKDKKLTILEPSAGHGALLEQIPRGLEYHGYFIEPIKENAKILRSKGYDVIENTFEDFYKEHIKCEKDIDVVIMNPPFSQSRDIKHTMMAYELLKNNGVLVSVISENALYYENEYSERFRGWIKDVNAEITSIPDGSFKESGTTIDTVMIKVVKGE